MRGALKRQKQVGERAVLLVELRGELDVAHFAGSIDFALECAQHCGDVLARAEFCLTPQASVV